MSVLSHLSTIPASSRSHGIKCVCTEILSIDHPSGPLDTSVLLVNKLYASAGHLQVLQDLLKRLMEMLPIPWRAIPWKCWLFPGHKLLDVLQPLSIEGLAMLIDEGTIWASQIDLAYTGFCRSAMEKNRQEISVSC